MPVERPKVNETTALGAAYLAGLGCRILDSQDEIAKQWAIDRKFEPNMDEETRNKLYEGWKKAVATARTFK